jgi:DNA polymerase elongation subunit (family B)
MSVTFHILDALSRDQRKTITRETADEIEIEYEYDAIEDAQSDDGRPSTATTTKANEMVIHLFGMTADGESLRCDITGFRPYLYVKVPDSLNANQFKDQLKTAETWKSKVPASLAIEREKRKELYGFTADEEFTFFKLSVASIKEFRDLKNLLLNDHQEPKFSLSRSSKPLPVYESGLDPLLRFFHLRNIQSCGWITVDPNEDEPDETSDIRVLTCEWTSVEPTTAPPKPSAPFKALFWDIECYSQSGDFPVAKPAAKGEKGDPIIQIGCVLKGLAGEITKTIFVLDKCDPIPTADVKWYKTEKAMLQGWFAWLVDINPDIWVGYNIFGFDERYIWERSEVLGITEDPNLQLLSRLCGHGGNVKLTEKRLSSSALGDNFLHTLSLQGRLQVDLYHVVKRGYQLPSYKLDEVTKYFMSGKLKKIVHNEDSTWTIQTSATGNAKVGRAVVLLDETGDELTDKLQILEVGSGILKVQPMEADQELDTALAVKWVIVKDDVSPADIFRLHRGSSADRATIAAYCIQDCDLTMDLYNKLEVFNNAMSMANVCTVPITMIFTRGQGVKIESLIFKFCDRQKLTILTLSSPPFNAPPQIGPKLGPDGEVVEEEGSYEGAIVLDPVPGFYTKSPIGVCDFASLYPSTIESENISYDSLLWVRDYGLDGSGGDVVWPPLKENLVKYEALGNKLGYSWIDISFDIWKADPADTRKAPQKIKTGIRVCRYAQYPGDRKAALPQIVRNLLAARAAKRAEIKKEADPFRKALLDAEQLAYKLTANSLYGQLGSGVFKVRLQHLAASVTAYGRKQILFAKAAIEHFYGPQAKDPRCSAQVVYGDTDSLFVEFNPRDPKTGERLEGKEAIDATISITEEAGHFITKALKPPHDFEFDKVFYPFIIFTKKRYVGNMYEENSTDFVQKSMGIAMKRRDYAPILKTVYGGAVKHLLMDRDVAAAAAFVKRYANDLMDNKVSLSQLLLTRSLRSEYKSATPPAHKILADRIKERDPGNAPASGDRLSFIYFKPPAGFSGNQGERVETLSFMKANGLKPDPLYYLEHQLESPIGQLFSILVDQLPGARPPPQGWSADPEIQTVEREKYAREYLFKQAKEKGKTTLLTMWGLTPTANQSIPIAQSIVSRAKTKASVAAALKAQKAQPRADSLFEDRMLVAAVKREKKKGKATLDH